MDLKRIDAIAREQLLQRKEIENRETGHLYWHGLRVAKIALAICDKLGFEGDRDIVYVGGLFHDLGKGQDLHHVRGAEMVPDVLADACTPKELEAVCHIIRYHNDRGKPDEHLLEVKAIQDADLLDHVGPVEVWATLRWSQLRDENVDEKLRWLSECWDDDAHRRWQNALNFDVSRKSYERRRGMADLFYSHLERAHLGELFT